MERLFVFANFFIDNSERLQRMKDSYVSFKDIGASKWVINVRGRYRSEAMAFLKEQLGDKLIPFHLDSRDGWFHDTRQMLSAITGNYVLFWVEDHINLADTRLLDDLVAEMDEQCLDVMKYSWWCDGIRWQRYKDIELIHGRNLDFFEHNEDNNKLIQASPGGQSYLISSVMIIRRELFFKIILADDPIPRRWPKELPFDFEKGPFDTHWLPLKVALPRQELFGSIDDDAGCPGYCLQSRGLYPVREKRKSYAFGIAALERKFFILTSKLMNKIRAKF